MVGRERLLLAGLGLLVLAGPAVPQCEVQRVMASDATVDANFGVSLDLSGDRAVVGAVRDVPEGSAYVFERISGVWVETAKLTASDPGQDERFGAAVAIDGDWIAIGDFFDNGHAMQAGAVYLFHYSGGTWVEDVKLTPADLAAVDEFGWELDLDGGRLVASAAGVDGASATQGALYVFELEGTHWVQKARIDDPGAGADDVFGSSVAVSGDRILAGARGSDLAAKDAGTAYVFVLQGGSWVLEATLDAPDAEVMAQFGEDVALQGSRALVGAYLHGLNDPGAAYVFEYDGTGWGPGTRLMPSAPADHSSFGHGLAIAGDLVFVAAPYKSFGHAGEVYAFGLDGSEWRELNRLRPQMANVSDSFGVDMATSGDDLLIGAYETSDGRGAAHFFSIAGGGAAFYCVGAPNSVGPGARMGVTGPTSLVIDQMTLRAYGMPPGQFSVFCYGPDVDQVPVGDGFLCIGAGAKGIFRLLPPILVDGSGTVSRAVDIGAPPLGSGAGQVLAGETWNFQSWYRDPKGPGGSGSNFTDAMAVTFCE